MHISNNKFRLAEFKREHIPECSLFMAKMFHKHNNTWIMLAPKIDDVINFMIAKNVESLDWQDEARERGLIAKDTILNFIYLDSKNNIVAAWTNYHLSIYLANDSRVNLPQFNTIQKYGMELEKSISEEDRGSKKAVYTMFAAIQEHYMGSGMVYLFTYDVFSYLHSKGMEVFCGRYTSVKFYKILLNYGGETTAQIEMSEEENCKDNTLYFVRFELKNHVQMVQKLQKIIANPECC